VSITESASVSDTERNPAMFYFYTYSWSYRIYRPVVYYTWSCF
jgi:hypothetical protein